MHQPRLRKGHVMHCRPALLKIQGTERKLVDSGWHGSATRRLLCRRGSWSLLTWMRNSPTGQSCQQG